MESTRTDMAGAPTRGLGRNAVEAPPHSANKVWVLRSKNPMDPPFHFVGVPPSIDVVAADEESARAQAAASGTEMVPAGFATRDGQRVAVELHSPWMDADLTTCEEVDLTEPRVLARAMGA